MRIIIDAHAHLYPEYPPEAALRTVVSNFRQLAAGTLDLGVLCLTQTARSPGLPALAAALSGSSLTEDGAALSAQLDGTNILVFDGQQLVSDEGLEVLALCPKERLPWDDAPVREIIARISARGGIAVLPWSPGKWLGKRGRIIRSLLDEQPRAEFLLGDIALRPAIFPRPAILRSAAQQGISIVHGSDPLPHPSELKRLGSFGMRYDGDLRSGCTREALIRLLKDAPRRLAPVGGRPSPVSAALTLGAHFFRKNRSAQGSSSVAISESAERRS